MFDIANFFSFLAALAVWDFVCHRQDFMRGFRSGWNRSRLPKGPKPNPLRLDLKTIQDIQSKVVGGVWWSDEGERRNPAPPPEQTAMKGA